MPSRYEPDLPLASNYGELAEIFAEYRDPITGHISLHHVWKQQQSKLPVGSSFLLSLIVEKIYENGGLYTEASDEMLLAHGLYKTVRTLRRHRCILEKAGLIRLIRLPGCRRIETVTPIAQLARDEAAYWEIERARMGSPGKTLEESVAPKSRQAAGTDPELRKSHRKVLQAVADALLPGEYNEITKHASAMHCTLKNEALAKITGLSLVTVSKAIRDLQSAGYIGRVWYGHSRGTVRVLWIRDLETDAAK